MDYTNASGIDPYAHVGGIDPNSSDAIVANWQNRATAQQLYQQAIQQGNIANQQSMVNLGRSQYDLSNAGLTNQLNIAQQPGKLTTADYQNQAAGIQGRGLLQNANISNQDAANMYLSRGLAGIDSFLTQQDASGKTPIDYMNPSDRQAAQSQITRDQAAYLQDAKQRGILVGDLPNSGDAAGWQNYVNRIKNWQSTSPEMLKANLQAQTQLGVEGMRAGEQKYSTDVAAQTAANQQANQLKIAQLETEARIKIGQGKSPIEEAKEILTTSLGRNPNPKEISDFVNSLYQYRDPRLTNPMFGGMQTLSQQLEQGLAPGGVPTNNMAPQPQVPQPQQQQGPIQIRSDAEYNQLPPGSIYVGPDGVPRRK